MLSVNGKSTGQMYLKTYSNLIEVGSTSNAMKWNKKLLKKGTYTIKISDVSGSSDLVNVGFHVRDNASGGNTYAQLTNIANIKEQSKTFTLDKDTEVVMYVWQNLETTFTNFKCKIQLERERVATDYIEHQEDSKILNIQQEMLLNDIFEYDEIEKKWYEVHNWIKINIDSKVIANLGGFGNINTELKLATVQTNNAIYDNLSSEIYKNLTYCNCFKGDIYPYSLSFVCVGYDRINKRLQFRINTDEYKTAEEFKTALQNNNIYVFLSLATPLKLECTAEQTEVLNYLTNKIKTYKNITNITTDSIALIDVTYKKDRETTDNNFQKQIDELKALLSTTKTSAMLLDNMQIDLEREVM